ncbi:MAG: GntR family transcriptional regulator [Lachnospiraceae bacterium]|nr:GntR family transcriptional regulator [Lachnospiraceae bacterium]
MDNEPSLPLYLNIKNYLLKQIQESLAIGDRLPTEAEIMEQFHVSRITVTKALKELKEEGYIVRYPSKGSFVASKDSYTKELNIPDSKDTLSGTAYSDIMCMLPYFSDQFSLNIINGITSILPPRQYNIHMVQSRTHQKEDYLLKKCFQSDCKGLILFPVDQIYYSNQLLRMKLNNYPMVLIDRILPGIDTNYVAIDNVYAGKIAFEHLFMLGHRNLLFITHTSKDVQTVKSRIKGLWQGSEESGLLPSCIHIEENLDIHKPFNISADYIARVLAEKHITAVICCESKTCLYMYSLLCELGLKVPKDISMISFDNPTNDISDFNFFTHIDQHEYLMGQYAGKILLKMLENGQLEENEKKILTPTLEIRHSTTELS